MKIALKIFTGIIMLCATKNALAQGTLSNEAANRRQYLKMASSKNIDTIQLLKVKIDSLGKTHNEKDMSLANQLYYRVGQTPSADSILQVILKKFPKGENALIQKWNKMADTKGNSAVQIAAYKGILKEFPEPKIQTSIWYDYARTNVAYQFAQEGNFKAAVEWLNKIKDPLQKASTTYMLSEVSLAAKDTLKGERFAKQAVEGYKIASLNSPNPMMRNDYYNLSADLSYLLFKEGKYEEAKQYVVTAFLGSTNQNNVGILEPYALIMDKTGNKAEAFKTMTTLMKMGKASSLIKIRYQSVYVDVNGSNAGYSQLMAEIAQELKQKMQQEITKELINEPAPLFMLKDLQGKEVSLADLKGKVVILDFWATWCGPCKRSFPAMQLAVNRYKNDPNVCFLFIDTWERISDPVKDVKQFITENNYSFRVLLDSKTQSPMVVDKFKLNLIPAKFVIDGLGNIRFKISGFPGGDEAAVEEISAMIDIAKKGSL